MASWPAGTAVMSKRPVCVGRALAGLGRAHTHIYRGMALPWAAKTCRTHDPLNGKAAAELHRRKCNFRLPFPGQGTSRRCLLLISCQSLRSPPLCPCRTAPEGHPSGGQLRVPQSRAGRQAARPQSAAGPAVPRRPPLGLVHYPPPPPARRPGAPRCTPPCGRRSSGTRPPWPRTARCSGSTRSRGRCACGTSTPSAPRSPRGAGTSRASPTATPRPGPGPSRPRSGRRGRELGHAPDPEAVCCEGQGLYPSYNACNHSRVPSARDRLLWAEGGRLRLQVTTLRRLRAGDEVVVAYVGRDLSYAERQARPPAPPSGRNGALRQTAVGWPTTVVPCAETPDDRCAGLVAS